MQLASLMGTGCGLDTPGSMGGPAGRILAVTTQPRPQQAQKRTGHGGVVAPYERKKPQVSTIWHTRCGAVMIVGLGCEDYRGNALFAGPRCLQPVHNIVTDLSAFPARGWRQASCVHTISVAQTLAVSTQNACFCLVIQDTFTL